MASACLGFAVAPAVQGTATTAVLAASILLLTLGELFQVGAAWALSFAVAPAESRNVYLSVFGMGRTIGGRVAGPLVMTGVVLALGSRGWIALAFLLMSAAAVPVIVSSRTALAAVDIAKI